MRSFLSMLLCAAAMQSAAAAPAVVGHHRSAESLSETRIVSLPHDQREQWRAYLIRSRMLMARDKAVLNAERGDRPSPPLAPKGPGGGAGMPLDREAAWYASAEALHVAENILSFQTPAGGWGKNQDRTGPVRVVGQSWASADVPWAARDIDGDPHWAFIGTIDNNGTTQELRYLARVQRQFPGEAGERYRAAFLKGVRYLLTAQYPNGGWPQVFPLIGGYHDAITFNDGAMAKALETLAATASREGDYAFVPEKIADAARNATRRGYTLVLRAQRRIDGRLAIWSQQCDALTLAPVGARNWEPGAMSSEESATMLLALMRVDDPSPAMQRAIRAGVAWLRDHALHNVEWPSERPAEGRRLIQRPGAPPLWPRLYDARSGKPIFGARDKTIHDTLDDLPADLRNSYQWFGRAPAKALLAYERWHRKLAHTDGHLTIASGG